MKEIINTIWLSALVAMFFYSVGRLHEHMSHMKRLDFIKGRGNYPGEHGYKKKFF